jgi:murein L,D-transpeptidase YcbB/YkuD
MNNLLFCFFLLLILISCNNQPTKPIDNERTVNSTLKVSYSTLLLDSAKLEGFIKEQRIGDSTATQLREFYKSRDYQFAWFTKDGIAEHTHLFWNLHNSYINTFADTALKYQQLHKQMNVLLTNNTDNVGGCMHQTELLLTKHFFEYSSNAYSGRVDPRKLQWHIPRRKLDEVALLDSFMARKGKSLEDWEPVNLFYKRLKKSLLHYYEISKAGGWKEIEEGSKKRFSLGDSAALIKQIKQRLFVSGQYKNGDSAATYTSELIPVIKSVQKGFGLKQDGVITTALIEQLNIPVKARIKQLLLNLERMRWVPEQPGGDFIIVNIPEFRLHVFEGEKKRFSIDIVVGKEAHSTVIFTGSLKYVVFSPYWNVPPSIVRNEIVHAIKRNGNYLSKNGMEQIGYANGLPVIRQKPGSANALGKVKFLFPNSYNIYFHDTPAKSLFSEDARAFSHGCIRLAEPQKLAAYLLRNQAEWTGQKINTAMSVTKEKWVTLKEPLPVFITYFTAWVDNEGLLNFRDDIYGHDKKLAIQLLVK